MQKVFRVTAVPAKLIGLALGWALGTSAWAGVSISADVSVTEPDSGEVPLTFQIDRSGSIGKDILISVETSEHPTNPASPGSDYASIAAGTKLLIPDGAPNTTVPVTIFGDLDVEPDESFFLHLTQAVELGDISFEARDDFTVGSFPRSVATGDLDGDGKVDLVAANQNPQSVSVLRNTGRSGAISANTFQAPVDFAIPGGTTSVAVGDLDGDGKLDLATVGNGANVSVLRNVGIPGMINASSFATGVDFATGGASTVSLGDVDGDGKLDIVTTNSASISVLRNASTPGGIDSGSFESHVDFAAGVCPKAVAIGDLDGDGKADIVAANWGNFCLGGDPSPVPGSDDNVSVFRNTSTPGSISVGSLAARVDYSTGDTTGSVAIGDLDGDGKPDLVVASEGIGVSAFRNVSSPGVINAASFQPRVDLASIREANAIAISDLDGDGKLDLMVTNYGSDRIVVLRNASDRGTIDADGFQMASSFAASERPSSITSADLNSDGQADLVVGNRGDSISVFEAAPAVEVPIATSEATGTILTNELPSEHGSSSGGALGQMSLIFLAGLWAIRRRHLIHS